MAYLTGPNSAATMPNSASATNRSGIECRKKPPAANAAAKISANFSRRATTDLTNLSASSPPRPERMKKGKMKTAPATVTSASPWPSAAPYSSMMTSAFFKTLSLSAEQNCAQNSGAKRRDDINCLIMVDSWFLGGQSWLLRIMTLRDMGRFKNDGRRSVSASLGAEQPLGSGFFYSVDHAACCVKVAKVLGEREA